MQGFFIVKHMQSSLKYGLLSLWILFPVAFIISFLANKYIHSRESTNTVLRLKSWFIILCVFSALFFLPDFTVNIIFILLFYFSCKELAAKYKNNRKIGFFFLYILIITFLSLFSAAALFYFKNGKQIFFFIAVCTQLNDIFQYLWGKSLGKTPLAPKISPNKTCEGFAGGVFTTAILTFFTAGYFTGLNGFKALLLGIITACLGAAGDLTVSALKRQLNIKDFGNLLPGHGGLLDRIDSLLYTMPFALLYLYFYLR